MARLFMIAIALFAGAAQAGTVVGVPSGEACLAFYLPSAKGAASEAGCMRELSLAQEDICAKVANIRRGNALAPCPSYTLTCKHPQAKTGALETRTILDCDAV